jgi:hypothetical protein
MVKPMTGMNWVTKHRKQLSLFLVLLVSYTYFFPRWASWSQNSRLDLVMAIVDQRTLRIDDLYENTGDYAYFEGHYYSDKAPGLSFLGVPVYMLFRTAASTPPARWALEKASSTDAFSATLQEGGTGILEHKVYFAAALAFVTFFTVSLPAALLGLLVHSAMARLDVPDTARLAVTLVYGLATPAFAYGGMFFTHQTVAFLLFLAFYLVFRPAEEPLSGWRILLVGFLLGWATISEYPAVLIAAGVAAYALYKNPSIRTVVLGLLGALVPLSLLALYDVLIFRTPLPVGYLYSENYHHLHDVGLVSITYPRLEALWGLTFSRFRGLFFLSPILLLALAGIGQWLRRRIHQPVLAVAVWSMISLTLFYGSSIMWQGGFAVGPRYLLPMLPFMALGLGVAWTRCYEHPVGRLVVWTLTLWSVAAVWLETISGQSFPDWTLDPLFAYSLPRFLAGDIARNWAMAAGLHAHVSLLPLAAALLALGLPLYLETRPQSSR